MAARNNWDKGRETGGITGFKKHETARDKRETGEWGDTREMKEDNRNKRDERAERERKKERERNEQCCHRIAD